MHENMKLINPLQMNDWEFKKFLCIVISIQFSMWGLVGLDVIGLQIPILRQAISFIYLTFVPGITILRILKLHKLGNAETLLYAIGLSISTLMFTGFLMNVIYPYFGINRPISTTPLVITISIVISILYILSYLRDKDYSDPSFINVSDVLSPKLLFFCLLPFLSILGTYLVNFYNINILLLILLAIISIIPILLAYGKLIEDFYEPIILLISVSLLYHRSLISTNLWGWDIHTEYYFSKLVVDNSIWNSTFYENVNSLLSLTMLTPIYSKVCYLSLTWVFKIICPLLFSLVPLGLYIIYKKQTDNTTAFMSVFFFMSIFTFYNELTVLIRQEIAELFLTLLILLNINETMEKTAKAILVNICIISLVVSHYAVTYIYLFIVIIMWATPLFINNPINKKIYGFCKTYLFRYSKFTDKEFSKNLDYKPTTYTTILFIFVFTLSWYMYVADSSTFNIIVSIIDRIVSNFIADFSNPDTAEGTHVVLSKTTSFFYATLKDLHLITQLFIFIGIFKLITKHNIMKFKEEYSLLSVINFGICVGAIVIPYFAVSLTVTRLYHITTIFLAPFCVIGGETFLGVINQLFKKLKLKLSIDKPKKILSIFFTIFFLFNTGFLEEIITSNSYSISLDNTIDYPRFNEKEMVGSKWAMNMTNSSSIYADSFGRVLLYEYTPYRWKIGIFNGNTDQLPNKTCIFLRDLNTKGTIMVPAKIPSYEKTYDYAALRSSIFFNSILCNKNKIYANGGSEVYM